MPYKDPEARKANKVAYYQKHRQRLLKWQQDWYAANREDRLPQIKRWRDANPEKVRAAKKRARNRKILAEVEKQRKIEAQRFPRGLFDREAA